ncbi:hypothetical protein ATANTOWER_024216 [Ataeniobius toweri]|uniref:Uncharacterized protein n=1 Tax=Ataeniobius toweri TaxID=208326 RepID=A0ABU7AT75_9TELE|nr:hypothetical protein [Ataeniobius toweri]
MNVIQIPHRVRKTQAHTHTHMHTYRHTSLSSYFTGNQFLIIIAGHPVVIFILSLYLCAFTVCITAWQLLAVSCPSKTVYEEGKSGRQVSRSSQTYLRVGVSRLHLWNWVDEELMHLRFPCWRLNSSALTGFLKDPQSSMETVLYNHGLRGYQTKNIT